MYYDHFDVSHKMETYQSYAGEKNEGSTNLKILLNGLNNLEVTAKNKHKGKHSSSVILKQLKNGSLLVPVNEINNQKDGTCSNRIS